MTSLPADALAPSSHPYRPAPEHPRRAVRPRPPRARLFETVRFRFITRARPRLAAPAPDVAIDRALRVMLFAMFTVVVFLLPFFRAPTCMCAGPDLRDVPLARNADPPAAGPVLQVTRGAVLLDGARVASLSELRGSTDRVDRIYERLNDARRNWPVLHPDEAFHGDISLIVDRDTEWRVLRRLAPTLETAGYSQWGLIVTVPSPAALAWDRRFRGSAARAAAAAAAH